MSKLFFVIILLIAAFFRFYGLNWDQNQHLHPDERFLTMVAGAMKWPTDYLNTQTSTLNPHNIGYGFYVYGTFSGILVKFFSSLLTTHYSLTGIAFGLAVASKITAVLFAPVIFLGFVVHLFSHS